MVYECLAVEALVGRAVRVQVGKMGKAKRVTPWYIKKSVKTSIMTGNYLHSRPSGPHYLPGYSSL